MKIIYSKYGTYCKKGQRYFAIPESDNEMKKLSEYETQIISVRKK